LVSLFTYLQISYDKQKNDKTVEQKRNNKKAKHQLDIYKNEERSMIIILINVLGHTLVIHL
jgi:hypothetical protein